MNHILIILYRPSSTRIIFWSFINFCAIKSCMFAFLLLFKTQVFCSVFNSVKVDQEDHSLFLALMQNLGIGLKNHDNWKQGKDCLQIQPSLILLDRKYLLNIAHLLFEVDIKPLNAHIGSEKVSTVHCSVSRLSRFVLRMRAILLLCQSVGHLSEVLK